MSEVVVVRGRLVRESSVVDDGVVVASGGRVAVAGSVADAVAAGFGADVEQVPPAPGTYLLPGLVDLHNHGGGGASFPDVTTAEQALPGVLEHRRHGTTTLLASLVTAQPAVLLERAAVLAELAEAGEIEGLHAEGPFLSHRRRGAHNPADLQEGSAELVRDLVRAARGHLRTMTVAPEVPGVVGPGGVAEALVEAGVLPSLGHTDGTTEQAETLIAQVRAGLAAAGGAIGPLTATHLFNGMRPLHHRAPGPIAACLAAAARGDMAVELIGDGVHLDPATVRSVFDMVGAANVVLVTDAMAAAGVADGRYDLGPMSVEVREGVARIVPEPSSGADAAEGAIAGGTAHLVDVVRLAVRAGVPLVDAVRAATAVPAHVLGLSGEVGALVPGARADVLVTDADLRPLRVLRHGAEVSGVAGSRDDVVDTDVVGA
ncbi:N-acetylglucosamine-6-phosphate deacetylase [Promicromonospora thailandica]|uniref:N-acetylglucosamine-6-phosphate deacetylase n=1 Tax=Promicromonospora thailandica TaxID=765201 RepID=A0A9X2G5R0_9MICO|nr:amidohydrolase family protein [Promicromonospora thailandica]MCP2266183.1 N-acetylglucosamine-6-phosphate deacetylase [Promicromonospora thailandica]